MDPNNRGTSAFWVTISVQAVTADESPIKTA